MPHRQPKLKYYIVIQDGQLKGTVIATTKAKALVKAKKLASVVFGKSNTVRVFQVDKTGWKQHPKNRRYN